MANSSNAFATVTPLNNNISDWVNNQEMMGMRAREEKRHDDQLKALAAEKEQKKKDALLKNYDLKAGDPTGIKSIDGAQQNWLKNAIDKTLPLYKKQMAGGELTPEESSMLRNVQNLPENISHITKSYVDDKATYLKEVQAGIRKRDLEYELKMEKMAEGAIAFIDDNGFPAIGFDNDGDGKPDVYGYDPSTGFDFKPKFIPNVDYDTVIKGISANLEPEENQTDNNFLKVKTTGVGIKDAERLAEGAVMVNGKPTPFAISYLYDAGIEPEDITEEDLQKLVVKVSGDLRLAEKRGKIEDRDNSAETSRMREGRQAKKDAKQDQVYKITDLNHTTNTKQGDDIIANNYQGNVKIERKVGQAVESFRSFGLDKNNNIVVTVDVASPKYTDKDIERMTDHIEDDAERVKKIQELNQERKIETKQYKSDTQADHVMHYGTRFLDPETGDYIKSPTELKNKLRSRGQGKMGEPEKQKIQGF